MQNRNEHALEHLAPALARAERLVHAFNGTGPGEDVERRALLEALLGFVGADVVVRPRFVCELGTQIRIGAGTFVHYDCLFVDLAPITIGSHCRIAPGVHIYTAAHPLAGPQGGIAGPKDGHAEPPAPVTIGDGVWIGSGARIMPGVTIGDRAVIAAGCLVFEDVRSDARVVGVPGGLMMRAGEA